MPLTLTRLTHETLPAFEKLYHNSFPRGERLPVSLLRARIKRRIVDGLALMRDDEFMGLAVNIADKDFVLVLYFAIAENTRGQGIGTQALRLIKEYYAGKTVFLEIEDPAVPAGNSEQRIKRETFYQRSGFKDTGIRCVIYGEQMKLLTAGKAPSFAAYRQIVRQAYGPLFIFIHPKAVKA